MVIHCLQIVNLMQQKITLIVAHVQKIFEELKLKNLGDYHDLYVQSDTLLLSDVFENIRN